MREFDEDQKIKKWLRWKRLDWEIISGKTRKIKEVVKSKSLKKQRPKKSKESNVPKQDKPKTANERVGKR